MERSEIREKRLGWAGCPGLRFASSGLRNGPPLLFHMKRKQRNKS
jgi:hypothetical protein